MAPVFWTGYRGPLSGLGGYLSEQARLVAEHLHVREAVAAIRQGYRQVHQH